MSDETVPQRRVHAADPDRVSVRAPDDTDDGDGLFRIRMPVTSTAEARDGDAFSREKVAGFAEQIGRGDIGVFLDHGTNQLSGSRYSALGKVGYWDSAELEERDGFTELVADAVLADPADLEDDVGPIREALAWVKTQAQLGFPLASSVGWSDATGDRDLPGDSDLLEISIVGIPSDPNTTTASAEPAALARAVSAASSEFDVDAFVEAYRAVTAENVQDATPVHVDGQAPATTGRAEYEVGDTTVDLTPPEAMQNAAEAGLEAKQEYDDLADCGTGVGEERARQIIADEVGPEVVDEVASYLTSHEEDVAGITDPPTDWSEAEWTDGCGPVQYALWGGTATGTGLEWAQRKANAVAEAKGEELPYPDRAARNLDDPAFAEGDAVMWTWQDEPVHGRVAGIHEEFTPPEADAPITGDEGEAVYSIHEWDEESEAFEAPPNVAKPESSLDESTMDLPPASEENTKMSESNEPGDDSGTDGRTETLRAMEEKMDEVREYCERMDERTREMYEEMMPSDEAMDGDGEGDEEEEEDDGEMSADGDDERTVTVDGEERSVEEVREEIAALRDQLEDAEPAESKTRTGGPDAEPAGDEGEERHETDADNTFGF